MRTGSGQWSGGMMIPDEDRLPESRDVDVGLAGCDVAALGVRAPGAGVRPEINCS